MDVNLLCSSRKVAPAGLQGGADGLTGLNQFKSHQNGLIRDLPGVTAITAEPGDTLIIKTPGGGGYGSATLAE